MIAPLSLFASPWSVLTVNGPDAAAWLNGIVTCDTKLVVEGQGAWGLLLTKTGKIQAELQLVGGSSLLWMAVSGGSAGEVKSSLERYLVMEDAELSEAPELRFVCFYGRGAREFADELRDVLARDAKGPAHSGEGAKPTSASMPWAIGSAAMVVQAGDLEALVAKAVSMGATDLGAADALGALDQLRVVAGLPLYGVDFGARDNPHEASLDRRAVSWSKGCYLGQEVVCMQDMRGKVKRRLVRLDGHAVGWQPQSAVHSLDGTEVGKVTTVAGNRALASVVAPWFEPQQELRVLGHPVSVSPLDPT